MITITKPTLTNRAIYQLNEQFRRKYPQSKSDWKKFNKRIDKLFKRREKERWDGSDQYLKY